jgi:division protein CdvB (Snf7/Vps24/ESCRT-III family)
LKLKGNVGDLVSKVVKDMNAIRNILKAYEKQQAGMNQAQLKNGTSFFENICTVDVAKMETALDEEIATI